MNDADRLTVTANETMQAAPPVEKDIAFDMVRRSLPFIPVLLLLSAGVWGVNGALSCGYAIALVLANLSLSAVALSWAARHSLGMLMGVAMFGYLFRLGLIAAAVLAVHSQSWVEIVPLGLTIIVTHLGLLFWELRFASISFAYPGVKPVRTQS